MIGYSPTFYSVKITGSCVFEATAGIKVDLYRDGTVAYGMGIKPQELVIYADAGAGVSFRFGTADMESGIGMYVSLGGVAIPGGLDDTQIGAGTARPARVSTLAVTGSLPVKQVLAAPTAAAGAPIWRTLTYADLSGQIDGINIGVSTPGTGRFSTLTAAGMFLQSTANNITAGTTNTLAGALGLTAALNNIKTAAANSAVRLPSTTLTANLSAMIRVRNAGANAVNVYPPSASSTINALAAGAAFVLAAGASITFNQMSATEWITTA